MPTSRRDLLQLSAATLAATLAGGVTHEAWAEQGKLPRDVGRKFYVDGRVKPFHGNTIVCHLPQQGDGAEPFNALLDCYREMPKYGFVRKTTLLPPSSYHMTIFGGANDQDRRLTVWPADVPLDMSMTDCNRVLGERLRNFRLEHSSPPYRMRVDLSEPATSEAPIVIRLLPVDEAEHMRLTRLRDRLAKLLAIRAPGHETYRFHITLAYLIQWLTPAEQAEFRGTLKGWREMLAQRCPIITFGAPEYCLLKDMFAFERQFYLS
jgi:hypothetical protein